MGRRWCGCGVVRVGVAFEGPVRNRLEATGCLVMISGEDFYYASTMRVYKMIAAGGG
jgi:hypothetical protein